HPSGGDHPAPEMFGNLPLDVLLDTVELHHELELSIWQLGQPQVFPGVPDITFHLVIPMVEILITHRPVHGDALLFVGLEIQVAPTVAVASPHNGPSTDMIAPHPIETLHFVVGVLQVVDEPMLGFGVHGVTGTCLFLLLLYFFPCGTSSMWK